MEFINKGYVSSQTKKIDLFGEVLFGDFYGKIDFFTPYNKKTVSQINQMLRGQSTYEDLVELDRLVAKRTLDFMWNNGEYFDVEKSYGAILRDVLRDMGAFNFMNFEYNIKVGTLTETFNSFYNNDSTSIFYNNAISRINMYLFLILGKDKILTNFVSLYTNDEELDKLWELLHSLKIGTMPYREDKEIWALRHTDYPKYNEYISKKYLQQLELFNNAII
jgi:hypothetical protein